VTRASADVGAASGTSTRSSHGGGSSTVSPTKPKPKRSKRQAVPVPPEHPGIARIMAIANQKGGVGKSTTAVSLGAALSELGFRVLVVDLDPQGNASTGLGIRHEAREITVYDVIVSEASVEDAIVPTHVPLLSAVPSTIDLAGAEIELVSQFSRETRLKKALSPIREGAYDFVLLDCPPSLGLLTINALTAAEELIVPIQCEYYALEGLGQLLRNVSLVQQNINPGLRLSGIIMTMFDPRTKLSEQVVDEVRRYFGDLVYDVIIPRTVRLSEAPGFGQPITVYDPKSKGAESYRQLGREVALRPPPAEPMPAFDDLPSVVVPPLETTGTPPAPLDEDELGEVPTVHEIAPAAEVAASPEPEPEPEVAREPEAVLEPEAEEGEPERRAEPEPEPAREPETVAEHAPTPEAAETREGATPARSGPSEAPSPAATPPAPPPAAARAHGLEDDDVWEDADAHAERPRVTPPSTPAPPGRLPERRVVVIDEDAELSTDSRASKPDDSETSREGHDVADIGATLEDEDVPPKRRWRLFRKGGDR
jgi:chromosome partitioning protein